MLVCFITVKVFDVCLYFISAKFSLVLRQRQHLMSGSLDSPGFVYVDMCRFRSQHTFMMCKQSVDDSCIRLCTSYQKIYGRFGLFACFPYQFACMACIIIISISGSLFQICFHQAAHHLRMCPLHIVSIKM